MTTEAMEKSLQAHMPNHLVYYEWEQHEAAIIADCEKKGSSYVVVVV